MVPNITSLNKKSILNRRVLFKEVGSTANDEQYEMLRSKYTPLNQKSISAYQRQKDLAKAPANGSKDDENDRNDADNEAETLILFPKSAIETRWTHIYSIGPGFNNAGNTCFMNALLQCLTYTAPFANYLMSQDHLSRCQASGFCALCAMTKQVSRCLKSNDKSPLFPAFVKHLRLIAKQMRIGRQEDAHEFMRFLLESFQKNALAPYGTHLDDKAKLTNPIFQIFGGKLQSKVKCLTCMKESHTYDPFMDLALDIRHCDALEHALQKFSKIDQLTGQNRYNCEFCKKKRDAQKSMHIAKAPHVLTIQLKRFEFTGFGGKKLSRHVDFPESLDIKSVMATGANSPRYALSGVLVHSGGSSNSGHYYSFVKSPSGIWHCMDDSDVRQVKRDTVMRQNAYILFYTADKPSSPKKQSDSAKKHSAPVRQASLRNPSKSVVDQVLQQQQSTSASLNHTQSHQTPTQSPAPLAKLKKNTLPSADTNKPMVITSIRPKKPESPRSTPIMSTHDAPLKQKSVALAQEPDQETKKSSSFLSTVLSMFSRPPTPKSSNAMDVDGNNDESKEESENRVPTVIPINPITQTQPEVMRWDADASETQKDADSNGFQKPAPAKSTLFESASRKKSKRPSTYDIEYDRGKTKKVKTKNKWRVFDLQRAENPFSAFHIRHQKRNHHKR